jgi:hypothetical protein
MRALSLKSSQVSSARNELPTKGHKRPRHFFAVDIEHRLVIDPFGGDQIGLLSRSCVGSILARPPDFSSVSIPPPKDWQAFDRAARLLFENALGDAINGVLAAAGYNFRRLLARLRFLQLSILIALGLTAHLKSI